MLQRGGCWRGVVGEGWMDGWGAVMEMEDGTLMYTTVGLTYDNTVSMAGTMAWCNLQSVWASLSTRIDWRIEDGHGNQNLLLVFNPRDSGIFVL